MKKKEAYWRFIVAPLWITSHDQKVLTKTALALLRKAARIH